MLIPFLVPLSIAAASTIATTTGIVSGVKAVNKNNDARIINESAHRRYENAVNAVNTAREHSQKSLEDLGQAKLTVLDHSVKRFVCAFDQIHSISLKSSAGLEELNTAHFDKQMITDMREMTMLASSVIGGLAGGAGAGALAAFGAYSATMTFAAASTGTAIASLSGVAATNATLAFLGGGALAVGGGGIALGTTVLGGAVAGPAIAILGIVMNASASKNLDNAYSNNAKSKEIAEGCKVIEALCNGITARAGMFTALIKKLDTILATLTDEVEELIETRGCDYSQYTEDEQKTVAMALSVAKSVKQALDTPILDPDGNITEVSKNVYIETSNTVLGESVSISDIPVTFNAAESGEFVLNVLSSKFIKEINGRHCYLAEVRVSNAPMRKGAMCVSTSSHIRYGVISIKAGEHEVDAAYEGSVVTCELLAEKAINPCWRVLSGIPG